MNRKLISSLGMVVFAGAIIAGATGAFFSDSETSTGNTFTAGALDLKIDNSSYATDCVIPGLGVCTGALAFSSTTSWTLRDLTIEKFFNFIDLKPGDKGEDTISLHVENNAWICAEATITNDADNTITDPEDEVGGPVGQDGTPDGDLDSGLNFAFWVDDGDNVLETNEYNGGAGIFLKGPLSGIGAGGKIALADSEGSILPNNGPIPGGTTFYIGKIWCYGDLTAAPITQDNASSSNPVIKGTGWLCDGSNVGNIGQTDSVGGDLTFTAEQSRNNPNFTCEPVEEVPLATVTLDKVVTFTQTTVVGVDVNDFTLHLVGPGGDHILVDQVALPGLTPGAYVVSEVYSNDPAGIQFNGSFSGSCVEIGDTGTANMTVVAGVNPTCTITNLVVTPAQAG